MEKAHKDEKAKRPGRRSRMVRAYLFPKEWEEVEKALHELARREGVSLSRSVGLLLLRGVRAQEEGER